MINEELLERDERYDYKKLRNALLRIGELNSNNLINISIKLKGEIIYAHISIQRIRKN